MTAEERLAQLVGQSLTDRLRDPAMWDHANGRATGVKVKRLAAAVAGDLERAGVTAAEAVPA